MRARSPLSRQELVHYLQASADEFRDVNAPEAEALGELVGTLKGAGPLERLVRSAPRAAWLADFVVGIAKTWPDGLSVAASTIQRNSSGPVQTLVPTLSHHLHESDEASRTAALVALSAFAARGEAAAFHAIELRCFAKGIAPGERQRLVRALVQAGTLAIVKSSGGDVQDAVDIAVGIVDVAAKTHHFAELDIALKQLEPADLPVEVSVALLTSSRFGSAHLKWRDDFSARFALNLRTRKHPEADKIIRIVK
jgi:hypothetical protein